MTTLGSGKIWILVPDWSSLKSSEPKAGDVTRKIGPLYFTSSTLDWLPYVCYYDQQLLYIFHLWCITFPPIDMTISGNTALLFWLSSPWISRLLDWYPHGGFSQSTSRHGLGEMFDKIKNTVNYLTKILIHQMIKIDHVQMDFM